MMLDKKITNNLNNIFFTCNNYEYELASRSI